jgi:hypothetical protein
MPLLGFFFFCLYNAPPSSLMDSMQVQKWRHWKEKELGAFPDSQHFGGRRACWSSRMGIRKINKQLNHSHGPTQTKQRLGQCIAGALLMHRRATSKHKFIWLTMAQTWRKPPPSPLYYTLCLATRPTPKCHFVPGLPSGSPKIPKIGISKSLESQKFEVP